MTWLLEQWSMSTTPTQVGKQLCCYCCTTVLIWGTGGVTVQKCHGVTVSTTLSVCDASATAATAATAPADVLYNMCVAVGLFAELL
jgi:hypothetical protein